MLRRVSLVVLLACASAYPLVARWKPAVTQLTGADRKRFLHGLCSNDINTMLPFEVKDAAILDGRGNTKSLLTVIDDEERLLVLGAEGSGAELFAFFDKYIFPADDVAISDCSDAFCSCYEILGEQAEKVLSSSALIGSNSDELPAKGAMCRITLSDDVGGSALLLGQCSLGSSETERSFALLVEGDDEACEAHVGEALQAAATALGGGVAPSYDALRIRRGRPAAGREFGKGAPVGDASPLWLGLWSHVHLDKGCYMGNEVVTRVARARRQKYELFGLEFEAGLGEAALTAGAEVAFTMAAEAEATGANADDTAEVEEEEEEEEEGTVATAAAEGEGPTIIGIVTSVLAEDGFALALLRPPHQREGTRVSVGGRSARVVELPFSSRAGEQAGGGGGGDELEMDEEGQSAAEAKAKAEADRKAAKLAAMQAKMKALGLA